MPPSEFRFEFRFGELENPPNAWIQARAERPHGQTERAARFYEGNGASMRLRDGCGARCFVIPRIDFEPS